MAIERVYKGINISNSEVSYGQGKEANSTHLGISDENHASNTLTSRDINIYHYDSTGESMREHTYVVSGADRIDGSRYNDRIFGDGGNNLILGHAGHDKLYGNAGNDHLLGSSGKDLLDGGAGSDRLEGGIGNDVYFVDSAGDRVIELAQEGADYVNSSVSFALSANVEHLRLTESAPINGIGNTLANRIAGNAAANTLSGAAGNDALFGGAGSDRLEGGFGRDLLYGGADSDVFLFRTTESAGLGRARDVVRDFQHGFDLVHLAAIDADEGTSGNQSFNWIGLDSFSGNAGELRRVNSVVEGDVNGDGSADFQIAVLGSSTLFSSDFLL